MKRKIFNKLIEWKQSLTRKPLLLTGARQVGKTYIINEFGKNNYDNIIYCNLENEKPIRDIFDIDLNPKRIVAELEQIKSTRILPQKTLIVFDEIQACKRALTSLKYFKEDANEYHVIASGSLLGVALWTGGYSFPVGCVDMLDMYPMDFEEFLLANNQEKLIELIKQSFNNNSYMSSPIHELAMDWYKKYLYIGGMPEAISTYLQSKSFEQVREKHNSILQNYIGDMSKYASASEANKNILVFNNIAVQLAKENRKFKYSLLQASGARSREYEPSINWICTAGLASKLVRISEAKFPLFSNQVLTDFKLYLNDVGLLCALHNITPNQILSNNNVLHEFKGGLTENYVYNQLKVNKFKPYYWTSKREAELDFVVQNKSDLIPIEVKSNTNNHSPSLRMFVDLYKPKYSIRISARNFGFENNIKSVPLYALFCLIYEFN